MLMKEYEIYLLTSIIIFKSVKKCTVINAKLLPLVYNEYGVYIKK